MPSGAEAKDPIVKMVVSFIAKMPSEKIPGAVDMAKKILAEYEQVLESINH
jgi:hypothetical protein